MAEALADEWLTLPPPAETDAGREARLAHERALIEEAREDVRAGRVIHDEDVDAWLDLFVRGEPLPMPTAPAAAPGAE